MTTVIEITPEYVLAPPFDSRKRYIRKGAPGATFRIVKQDTMVIAVNGTGSFISWRYSDGSYSKAHTTSGASAISYDPTYTLVKF